MPETFQLRLIWLLTLRCEGPTEKMSSEELMYGLDCDETTLQKIHETFLAKGFIDKDWAVSNWHKRQYLSDSSTPRVQKYRANQALKQDETFQKREVKRSETQNETDQNRTEHSRTEKVPPPKAPVFEVPDWISKDSWVGFMEVRTKKRSPNTVHALNGIVRELEKIRACGTDPNASLEQSIMRGWSGVFELSNGNGNGKINPLEKVKFSKLEDFVNQ